MAQIDHNIEPGPITKCQVCKSQNLELVVDLGHQPLCDSLLTQAELNEPETYYPLRLFRCVDCSLAQIDYAVDGSIVYHPDYPYRSGITRELAEHQRAVASDVVREYRIPEDALVVDIGSNDGTLLTGFKRLGMRVLGVEPTDIAKIAREENGIDTLQAFFTEAIAQEIVKEHGPASAVSATNVFAHMMTLGDVMRGVRALLPPGGVFVTESHYLPEIIKLVQYDTIYHEHLRSYSLKSLICLFDIVFGIRAKRQEGFLWRTARHLYYRLISSLSYVTYPPNVGDFQLIDRKVHEAMKQFDDAQPFMRMMTFECGFRSIGIPYTWKFRAHGTSRNRFSHLVDQGMLGLISFSTAPIRLCSLTGSLIAGASLIYSFIVFCLGLFVTDLAFQGIPTIIVAIFFFSGVQLIFLGLIGEYILAIYNQVRRRPYVIERERVNFPEETARDFNEQNR